MKILIVCSTSFYNRIDPIRKELEEYGHDVEMPNCFDDPNNNGDYSEMTQEEYLDFFKRMFNQSKERISGFDAILVANYTKEKSGKQLENYIGASTFLEMYEAFMQNKKIFMLNDFPDNMLLDELKAFNPVILNGNLKNVK